MIVTDKLTSKQRSALMAAIRSKNTKPELAVRSVLHTAGFRFRLHARELPGKPDIVLPRFHAAVFVHGCYWHGHDCVRGALPTTNVAFWRAKIQSNIRRDAAAAAALRRLKWRVITIWACTLASGTSRLVRKLQRERERL